MSAPDNSNIERLVNKIVASKTPTELAIGYLRYETLRRLKPRVFSELHSLNLAGRPFDDLVDEAMREWRGPVE